MKPSKFKLVNTPTVGHNNKGEAFALAPATKQAIVNESGNVVAYVPDFAPDGTAESLLAIMNNNRTVKLP